MNRISVALFTLLCVLAFALGCASGPEPEAGIDHNPPTAQESAYYAAMSQKDYRDQLTGSALAMTLASSSIAGDMNDGDLEKALRSWDMAYSALKHIQRLAKARGDLPRYDETLQTEQWFIDLRTSIKDGSYCAPNS